MKTPVSFKVKSWNENTLDGQPAAKVTGPKMTRAEVGYLYSGQIEAESTMQYVMCYVGDGTIGSYVGLEQINGSVEGKKGSFTLQHIGTFDKEAVNGKVTVVPNSATGELVGLRGTGSVDLRGHQESYPLQFEYDFEKESK